jgi:hypothetical protein
MTAKLWRGFHDIDTRKSKMAGKLWRGCHGIGTNQAPSDDWQTDGFPKHKLVLPSTVENLSVLPDAIILLVASCYCFQFFQIQGSSYSQPDVQLPTPVMERMMVPVVGSHHLLLRLLLVLLKVGVEVLVLQRRELQSSCSQHAPHQAARAQLGDWTLCVSF